MRLALVSIIFPSFLLGCSHQKQSVEPKSRQSEVTFGTSQPKAKPKQPQSKWVQYSTMKIVEEEGDFVGTDLRVRQTGDRYELMLICGEGVPLGPVRATFTMIDRTADVQLRDNSCGESPLHLVFSDRGVTITGTSESPEFVPLHKNMIREERWH